MIEEPGGTHGHVKVARKSLFLSFPCLKAATVGTWSASGILPKRMIPDKPEWRIAIMIAWRFYFSNT